MGFRTGAYAKIWEVKSINDKRTQLRISISRKNKQTGEYEQDFSGFVSCVGTAAAAALKFREGDRVKLGDVDVKTNYDKARNITYTNYFVYSFEDANDDGSEKKAAPKPKEVDGSDNDPINDRELPF